MRRPVSPVASAGTATSRTRNMGGKREGGMGGGVTGMPEFGGDASLVVVCGVEECILPWMGSDDIVRR